ncbi:MAG: hypothetical protein EBV83_10150, partial [Verrucomicrobia bacterium]|nr:hypothetical protein [Verrucomicrobiota bacterium]
MGGIVISYPQGDKTLDSALASREPLRHFPEMFFLILWLALVGIARGESPTADPASSQVKTVDPDWAQKAVWYQIFPERFHNGDPKNDPTPDYARVPDRIRSKWGMIPWTKEW